MKLHHQANKGRGAAGRYPRAATVSAGLALFAAFGALSGALAQEASRVETGDHALLSRRLTMGVGKSIIVDLPRDAAEVVVGNPKVANAIVRTARKLYILAAEEGSTTIFAVDAAGRQIANLEISIGRDVGSLDPLLKAALPNSEIVCKTINGTIILTGWVASAGDAQRAVDIARGYAKKSGGGQVAAANNATQFDAENNVVNALKVRGGEQVMVKVTVAEVERKVLKQLGFSAGAGGETILRGSWGKLIQENPFAINPTLTNSALQINGPNSTSATLKAFERYGVSRTLAEPTVTSVSGENAKLLVGGEIAVPGQSACTVYGTSAQPAVCSPSIVFKPYGVSLNLTPIVLAEGRIQMHLTTEVTEVDLQNTFTYNQVAVPGFKSRKNETTVELPSGGSIATAGLLTSRSSQAITGLPGLINLPILGALFRSRDYQREETELLLIVTPYVVHPIAQQDVARPDDNLNDASDPQGWLLGRVNRLYSTRSNPVALKNFKGRIGFIND